MIYICAGGTPDGSTRTAPRRPGRTGSRKLAFALCRALPCFRGGGGTIHPYSGCQAAGSENICRVVFRTEPARKHRKMAAEGHAGLSGSAGPGESPQHRQPSACNLKALRKILFAAWRFSTRRSHRKDRRGSHRAPAATVAEQSAALPALQGRGHAVPDPAALPRPAAAGPGDSVGTRPDRHACGLAVRVGP